MANDVLGEWALSEDEGLRFDALALIYDFRVCTAMTALDNLAAHLSSSTSPGAPYEVEKVQKIIARLNDSNLTGRIW